MFISKELIEFLKISQELIGTNLVLTDQEKTKVEITTKKEVVLQERKMNDIWKNTKLDQTVIREGNDILPLWKGENKKISSEMITPICNKGKQEGYLIYYREKGIFYEERMKYADTAKYFIEKFIEK